MATEQEIKAFWNKYAPFAIMVNDVDKRIFPETALVQWAVETGYGTSELCTVENNYAGITTGDGKTFLHFMNGYDFVNTYVNDLHLKYYTNVLNQRDITEQLLELGISPWAGSHYMENGIAGQELVSIYQNNKTQISVEISDWTLKLKEKKILANTQTKNEFWVQSGGFSDRANAQLVIDFCAQHGWWAGLYERV